MKASLVVLLLFVVVGPTWAAVQAPQNVRDLIVLGLEKNIGLQIEQINIPLTAEEINVESAAFDPEAFASANYSDESIPQSLTLVSRETADSDRLMGELGIRKRFESGLTSSLSLSSDRVSDNFISEDLDPRYRTALLLDLTQPLLRNFGTDVNTTELQVSRNQNRQSSYQYFFQAQRLALLVETLAVQFASDNEIVKLRKEAVQLAQELFAANKRRFEAGVIPVSEVQEAETDLANRQLSLSTALQAHDLTLERLNRLLDYHLPEDFSAESIYRAKEIAQAQVEVDLPDFDSLFVAAQKKRLDLKISRLDIDNRVLQKNFYDNQQLPQLDLKFLGGFSGLAGDEKTTTSSSRYRGAWDDSLDSMLDADGYQWQAGLEFSMPLGNQSAKARFRQAALQERLANYRKRDLEASLKQELLQQRTVLLRAAEQYEIASRFQTLAEKTERQEKRRVEEGLSDTFRLIVFQNNMINAKIDRIAALTQYHQALAQMNFSRGILLESHGINVTLGAGQSPFKTM